MGRFLRSKVLRNALWIAYGGKCALCGRDLPEDWHADHITPWSVTGRTNFYEMQPLCPDCNTKKGNRMQWQQFLRTTDKFQPRKGLIEGYDWAATVDTFPARAAAYLATGYGKTFLIYGIFEILRQRGVANRMIVFVPGDEHREQFVRDKDQVAELLGYMPKPWACDKDSREFRLSMSGDADIFVATYQQLGDTFFRDLMSAPSTEWVIAADEFHHLYQDGVWARGADNLPAKVRLYTSATPERSDGRELHGVPSKPITTIPYKEAYYERAVRLLVCRNEHYYIKCEAEDGRPHEFKTEDLLKERVQDFRTFEIKRQLRYKRDYLDWMLLNPLLTLAQKRARDQDQHQMIVFAMTCKHASFVCECIREMVKQLGLDLRCEWIGVGEGMEGEQKTDVENRRLVRKFKGLDEQGNKIPPEIEILVQVDKCGEGFSVKTASVLVFLNIIKAEPKLLQQLGRGTRRNDALGFSEDICDVFVSADSPVAKLLASMVPDVRERGEGTGSGEGPGLFDIPDIVVVNSNHSHRDLVMPNGLDVPLTPEQNSFCSQYGIPSGEYVRHFYGVAAPSRAPVQPTAAASIKDQMLAVQGQVKAATSILTGNIMKLLKDRGVSVDRNTAGRVKTAINCKWLDYGRSHESSLAADFKAKHSWLQKVNREIQESRRVPDWVMGSL